MLLQRVCRGMLTTLLLHGVLPVLQAEHHTCRYHSAAFQCKLMLFVSCILVGNTAQRFTAVAAIYTNGAAHKCAK